MADSPDEEDRLIEEGREFTNHLLKSNEDLQIRNVKFTYEDAIQETGYGKFHWFLLLLCGWAVSSDAIEVLSVSFILPSVKCDSKLQINTVQQGWLNAIIFIGMLIGGYFWGSMSDFRGRRAVLLWSLAVNGLGGLLSSLSQSYGAFIILRFISGIGVGGSMPVVFSYFVEFQPKGRRGSMISMLATFWMTGNIVAAGLAWIVIPNSSWGATDSSHFLFNSWRIYLALCTIPSVTSSLLFVFMPESPKYLMEKGDEKRALKVLEKVYKWNSKGNSDFAVKSLHISRSQDAPIFRRCVFCGHNVQQLFSSTVKLFQRPRLKITLIMVVIYATLSFGYYGLWMWFPELFKRIDDNGGSVCETKNTNETQHTGHHNCSVPIGTNIYFEGFLTAASQLPGNVFTVFFMDKLGRKLLLSSSMLVSGLSVFFLWFVSNKTQGLIMSCLFGGISVIGWNALDVLGTEIFPTAERSTAFGILSGVGRIASILANVVFGELVDVHCAVPMLMVAIFMMIGGLSVILLPNTTREDLQ